MIKAFLCPDMDTNIQTVSKNFNNGMANVHLTTTFDAPLFAPNRIGENSRRKNGNALQLKKSVENAFSRKYPFS